MEKYLNEEVIWLVTAESKTQWDGSVFEALNPNERGSIPEYANVKVPDGF